MLPAWLGSVIRTARGGRSRLRERAEPGTHQLLQSMLTTAAPPGGSAPSVESGGTTLGNAGARGGSETCRWRGARGAPTKRTAGRPASRHGRDPALRRVAAPVPPSSDGVKTNPLPSACSCDARHGGAEPASSLRSCAGTPSAHGTRAPDFAPSDDDPCPPQPATTTVATASSAPPDRPRLPRTAIHHAPA